MSGPVNIGPCPKAKIRSYSMLAITIYSATATIVQLTLPIQEGTQGDHPDPWPTHLGQELDRYHDCGTDFTVAEVDGNEFGRRGCGWVASDNSVQGHSFATARGCQVSPGAKSTLPRIHAIHFSVGSWLGKRSA
jgi:hypothetical protein